jgi:head-tail adaptor
MRNDGATKQSNAGEQQIQTLQIKCRWRPDITDDMGFTDGASHPTDFDIVGIDNVRMMNRVLIITLEKRSAT